MQEFSRRAWTAGIIPIQRIVPGEVLLPDFETAPERFACKFDLSRVAALRDDRSELFSRADIGVKSGWLLVSEAKKMVGIKPEPQDDVYLRSIATIEVPSKRLAALSNGKGLRLVRRKVG